MLTNLDIQKLSTVFDNRSSTYKFYWFLSLIDIVNEGRGHSPISFEDIVIRMLAKSWQPLKQGNFSFGKCDILIKHIDNIIQLSPLNKGSFEERVQYYLMHNGDNKVFQKIVSELTRYVPYRFLYPWTGSCHEKNNEIMAKSQQIGSRALYKIIEKTVIMNPLWLDYVMDNYIILRDFAYFRLCLFLEEKNEKFYLPVESSICKTADGMSVYTGYMIPNNSSSAFAAESSFFVKRLNVNQILCKGDVEKLNAHMGNGSTFVRNQIISKEDE